MYHPLKKCFEAAKMKRGSRFARSVEDLLNVVIKQSCLFTGEYKQHLWWVPYKDLSMLIFFPLVNKGANRITRLISNCSYAHMCMHKFTFLTEGFMCMPMSLTCIGYCSLKAQETEERLSFSPFCKMHLEISMKRLFFYILNISKFKSMFSGIR